MDFTAIHSLSINMEFTANVEFTVYPMKFTAIVEFIAYPYGIHC